MMWKKFFFFAVLPFFCIYPIEVEIFQLFKASQWKYIIDFFKKETPITLEQHYLFAKALEKEKNEEYLEAIRVYLLTAGIKCQNYPDFASCLKNYRNVSGIISNLSLLKAQSIAEKNKNFELQYEILKKGDYDQKDTIAKTLYQKYLQFIYLNFSKLNEEEIKKALSFYKKDLQSFIIDYYIAKIYKLQDQKEFYYYHIITAGINTKSLTNLKMIWNDLKENLDSLPKNYYRYLTAFYFDDKINQYLDSFNNYQILQTTNSYLLYYDGQYFIKNKNWDFLYQLSKSGYTYISQKPEILYLWFQELIQEKQYELITKIFNDFSHLKNSNPDIAKLYLITLKKLYKENQRYKELYFKELLSYLENFIYDIQIQDQLMDFLIIQDQNFEHFKFEERKYWELAYSKLPHLTDSGRFFYWLYRYYKDNLKNKELAQFILYNFYYFIPGSYYSSFFWEEIQKENHNKEYFLEWNKVNSSVSFYQWISRYGYLEEALKFLSSKNLSYFYHPKAIELQNLLRVDPSIPYEIVFLFKFGEYEFGFSLFNDFYKDKLTKIQYLQYLAIAGKKSNNLFIEVRAIRDLIRELKIPEDPFTLPPFILEKLYPRPYRNIVQENSKRWNISEDIIYALMRQESMFREDAISRSGAIGLMQIMPKTGEWLSQKLKIENYDLFKPEDSIFLGSKFFSDLMKMYEHNFHWASIAYNGGPGNLAKWKKKYYKGDFYYFLEILPSEESRNYCRKTYQNYLHYKISRILYDYGIRQF